MDIALVTTTHADKPVVERLLQLYEYDYSEYGEVDIDPHGVFPTCEVESIWRPGYHVFLIMVGGNRAGFAFVTHGPALLDTGETNLVDEFFVMRKYRRRGVGEHVAHALFGRFPGRWGACQLRQNVAAQAF